MICSKHVEDNWNKLLRKSVHIVGLAHINKWQIKEEPFPFEVVRSPGSSSPVCYSAGSVIQQSLKITWRNQTLKSFARQRSLLLLQNFLAASENLQNFLAANENLQNFLAANENLQNFLAASENLQNFLASSENLQNFLAASENLHDTLSSCCWSLLFSINVLEHPDAICFLLGNSPASEFFMPTLRNPLFHLHSQIGVE